MPAYRAPHVEQRSKVPFIAAGVVIAGVVLAGAWHFFGGAFSTTRNPGGPIAPAGPAAVSASAPAANGAANNTASPNTPAKVSAAARPEASAGEAAFPPNPNQSPAESGADSPQDVAGRRIGQGLRQVLGQAVLANMLSEWDFKKAKDYISFKLVDPEIAPQDRDNAEALQFAIGEIEQHLAALNAEVEKNLPVAIKIHENDSKIIGIQGEELNVEVSAGVQKIFRWRELPSREVLEISRRLIPPNQQSIHFRTLLLGGLLNAVHKREAWEHYQKMWESTPEFKRQEKAWYVFIWLTEIPRRRPPALGGRFRPQGNAAPRPGN